MFAYEIYLRVEVASRRDAFAERLHQRRCKGLAIACFGGRNFYVGVRNNVLSGETIPFLVLARKTVFWREQLSRLWKHSLTRQRRNPGLSPIFAGETVVGRRIGRFGGRNDVSRANDVWAEEKHI